MNKNKSASSYTNKWLRRNKQFWYEGYHNDEKIILLKKKDAPKIVVNRLREINRKRLHSRLYIEDFLEEAERSVIK